MAFATYLDKSSHLNRIRRLLHKQQYTNARNLAEALGPGEQALLEARIALQTGKGNVDGLVNRVPGALQSDEGLLFDRLKWRRKAENNAGAIEILTRQPVYENLYDGEDWGKERGLSCAACSRNRNTAWHTACPPITAS